MGEKKKKQVAKQYVIYFFLIFLIQGETVSREMDLKLFKLVIIS